jgi:hypothetical protein
MISNRERERGHTGEMRVYKETLFYVFICKAINVFLLLQNVAKKEGILIDNVQTHDSNEVEIP